MCSATVCSLCFCSLDSFEAVSRHSPTANKFVTMLSTRCWSPNPPCFFDFFFLKNVLLSPLLFLDAQRPVIVDPGKPGSVTAGSLDVSMIDGMLSQQHPLQVVAPAPAVLATERVLGVSDSRGSTSITHPRVSNLGDHSLSHWHARVLRPLSFSFSVFTWYSHLAFACCLLCCAECDSSTNMLSDGVFFFMFQSEPASVC